MGRPCWRSLQENGAIDAIVMDMNMPGMGGVETTASIRARADSYAHVPIIALTSQSDMKAVQACLAAGMNEVMIKPVQIGSLYACLARQFAQQRGVACADESRAAADAAAMPAGKPAADQGRRAARRETPRRTGVARSARRRSFLNGIEQIRRLVAQLAASVAAVDLESTHGALHVLLGVSGNIGARRCISSRGRSIRAWWKANGPWRPIGSRESASLSERSTDALQTYFATAKARRDHRDFLSD